MLRTGICPLVYDPTWELYLEAWLGWQLTQTRTGCSRIVIGRSTCNKDGQKRPRPARGVSECSSWMRGNSHVQFKGGGEVAIPPCYPAMRGKHACHPRQTAVRGWMLIDTRKPGRPPCG